MADSNNSWGGCGWGILIIVIALIGGGVLYQRDGGKVLGPGALVDSGPQADLRKYVPLKLLHGFSRQGGGLLFGDDRYKFEVTIYHSAEIPLSGRYIVRAYGDVFGRGGETSPESRNYDFLDVKNAVPGKSGGISVFYYVNNSALRKNGLDVSFVKETASMRIETEFTPTDSSEKDWKKTSWKFEVNKGEFKDLSVLEDRYEQLTGKKINTRK